MSIFPGSTAFRLYLVCVTTWKAFHHTWKASTDARGKNSTPRPSTLRIFYCPHFIGRWGFFIELGGIPCPISPPSSIATSAPFTSALVRPLSGGRTPRCASSYEQVPSLPAPKMEDKGGERAGGRRNERSHFQQVA